MFDFGLIEDSVSHMAKEVSEERAARVPIDPPEQGEFDQVCAK